MDRRHDSRGLSPERRSNPAGRPFGPAHDPRHSPTPMGDGEGSPNFRLIPEADTCLCLTGELDAAAAPALEAGLALVEHHSDLVLDLSRLTFLDAAGVGVLVD